MNHILKAAKSKMLGRRLRFDGIMAWFTVTAAILLGLSVAGMAFLEGKAVEQAAARNRQSAFLRISEFVGGVIEQTGGFYNLPQLQELIQDVRGIRPGIHRLSVFEITPTSSSLILSTDSKAAPRMLDPEERHEVELGRSVMQLDKSATERAWLITVPIRIEGKIVGALRGLYSAKEYDDLLTKENEVAKVFGIGAVLVTSLVFLLLIRAKIHQPIHQLLSAIGNIKAEDLSRHVSVNSPVEVQEVAVQFNRMLDRLREAGLEKDHLVDEIQNFNRTLQNRVGEATEELQRANLELVEARLSAERSQRLAALGELSATVAHELGNPLNVLSGHLQMLARSDRPTTRERHLSVIQAEIDRMVGIINQLLAQTHVHFRPAPVDLNRSVQDVLALLSPNLRRVRVVLHADLQADLPPVSGDQRALHGLCFNLITNAVQAMPSGGELTVRTCMACGEHPSGKIVLGDRVKNHGPTVRLMIADTGIGIPPELLSRICEPFFTTRHDQGGTGLGMAICHRVVTDCGGRLAVTSEVGWGTEFAVDIPLWNAERGEK
ncbi:sensor histidine kinase [Nitrospira sp. CMX1]|nr:HAMP domain-containing protein [Nitrospira sp.]